MIPMRVAVLVAVAFSFAMLDNDGVEANTMPMDETPAASESEAGKNPPDSAPSEVIPEPEEGPAEGHAASGQSDAGVVTAAGRYQTDGIRRKIEAIGKIVGNPNGKELLAIGDVVTIRFDREVAPQPGQRLVLARVAQEVEHPITGRNLGEVVKIVGTIELTEAFGKHWSGRILQSPDFAEPGDLILPMEAEEVEVPSSQKGEDTPGYIVAVENQAVLTGAFQTVYTDLGTDRGIKDDQEFTIIRDAVKGRQGSPPRTIGSLRIVSVRSLSSKAVVTGSAEPVQIGDRLEPKAKSVAP